MTTAAWVFFGLAATTAVVDWWAVARRRRRVEYVVKPGVMVWLIGAALAIDPGGSPWTSALFVLALIFSLAGDIFLMLEQERFIAGLASFVVAHVAYVVGLAATGLTTGGSLAAGVAVVVVGAAFLGRRIVLSARRTDPSLFAPVVGYVVVISAMVATAISTGVALAVAGSALFYMSDALLAWNRFVSATRHGSLAVIVTYHLGQALLVASLAAF
jgi:uncharacterized membrane protein YhhN